MRNNKEIQLNIGDFVHCLDTNQLYEYVGAGRFRRAIVGYI